MHRALLQSSDGQSAIFFVAFGGLTLVMGSQYQFGSAAQMGPGFFPVIAGGLLIVVGLMVGVQAVRKKLGPDMAPVDWRALFAITAAVLLSAYLLISVGLLAAIPALVIIGSLAGRNFRPMPVLLTAIVLTVTAWAVFILGLGLHIPVWRV